MNPLNNVISRFGNGNRKSIHDFCDNSPIGELVVDALDTFPPEDGLANLKRLHKELGDAITSWEGPSKAYDAPNAPPRQVRAGILENPFKGLVERVTFKDVPDRKTGGTVRNYKIQTGAAMFETYDRNAAIEAHRAMKTKTDVTIKWKSRVNGKYTNYDIVSLRVLDLHGRTQL